MFLTEKEVQQFIQKYFQEQYSQQQPLFSNGLNILIANNNPLDIQERDFFDNIISFAQENKYQINIIEASLLTFEQSVLNELPLSLTKSTSNISYINHLLLSTHKNNPDNDNNTLSRVPRIILVKDFDYLSHTTIQEHNNHEMITQFIENISQFLLSSVSSNVMLLSFTNDSSKHLLPLLSSFSLQIDVTMTINPSTSSTSTSANYDNIQSNHFILNNKSAQRLTNLQATNPHIPKKELMDTIQRQCLFRNQFQIWMSQLTDSPSHVTSSLSFPLEITTNDIEQSLKTFSQTAMVSSSSTRNHSSIFNSQSSANIEKLSWDDIGGLEEIKTTVQALLGLPINHPELFVNQTIKQGLLLYGPPGTGKTMVAKTIANECHMNFISIKGPELLDAYVGESEKNIRDLFSQAKKDSPCVIFFDEIDSIAPKRAQHGDNGSHVTDRIVSQLLTEMDQLTSRENNQIVFVVAATNRLDLLDSALLRPGRFDTQLYLGYCKTSSEVYNILKTKCKDFPLDSNINLQLFADFLFLNKQDLSGAQLSQFTQEAFLCALNRKIQSYLSHYQINDMHSEDNQLFSVDCSIQQIESLDDNMFTIEVSLEDFQQALISLGISKPFLM